jgi:hypothetical protein
MFHIPKKHPTGCAVATAAMIADLTYDEVAAWGLKPDPAKLRYTRQLLALLEDLTEMRWRTSGIWRPHTVGSYHFPAGPVAVLIQDAWLRPRYGQWIAVRGPIIHDPGLPCACLVKHYPRRDWSVSAVLEPRESGRPGRWGARPRAAFILEELSAQLASLESPGKG